MKAPKRLQKLQARPSGGRAKGGRGVLHSVVCDQVDRSLLPIIDDDPLAPLYHATAGKRQLRHPGDTAAPPGDH